MILSAKYPELVEKLVIWGANSYVIPEEMEAYESKFCGLNYLFFKLFLFKKYAILVNGRIK